MDSKSLQLMGFTSPIPFVEAGNTDVPKQAGVYIIVLLTHEIDYPMGKSDIVKIGDAENDKGLYMRWSQYFHPGPTQKTNIRLKPKFQRESHGFAWLLLEKGSADRMEMKLLAQFQREHGQLPAYNLVRN